MEKEEIEEIDTTPIPLPTNDLLEAEVDNYQKKNIKFN